MSEFTFDTDSAAKFVHHLADVSQTESEAFDIVTVACRYTVELVENLLKVVAAYAYSVVGHRDFKRRVVVDIA